MKCRHLGKMVASRESKDGPIQIHECRHFKQLCVATKTHRAQMPGSSGVECEFCPLFKPLIPDSAWRKFVAVPDTDKESPSGYRWHQIGDVWQTGEFVTDDDRATVPLAPISNKGLEDYIGVWPSGPTDQVITPIE